MNSNYKTTRKITALVRSVIMIFVLAMPAFAETDGVEECTYYFYAPEEYRKYGAPYVYWWMPSAPADWPGTRMTSAPEVGENVYKITAPAETDTIIFNNGNGTQTVGLGIDGDWLNNRIFVIDGVAEIDDGVNIVVRDSGSWLSIDPNDDDYYRYSDYYHAESADEPVEDDLPVVTITSGAYVDKADMCRQSSSYFTCSLAVTYDEAYTVQIEDGGKVIFTRTFYPSEDVYELDIYYERETRPYELMKGSKFSCLVIQANYETIYHYASTSDIPNLPEIETDYNFADNSYTGEITYYFLAPQDFIEVQGVPDVYWWQKGGVANWPGIGMNYMPQLGENVFCCNVPRAVTTIIFNGADNGYMTINIEVTEVLSGRGNVGNMIYVIDDYYDENPGFLAGHWYSLDPMDDNYYRYSDAYKAYCIENDTFPQVCVRNNPSIIAGEEGDNETKDEPSPVDVTNVHPYVQVEYSDIYYMTLSYDSYGDPIFYVDIPMDILGEYYDVWFEDGMGNAYWMDYGTLNIPGVYRLNYNYRTNNWWYETIYADEHFHENLEVYVRYVYFNEKTQKDEVNRVYLEYNNDDDRFEALVKLPQAYTTYSLLCNVDNVQRSYVHYTDYSVSEYPVCLMYYEYTTGNWYFDTAYDVSTYDVPDKPAYPATPDCPETADEPSTADEPTAPSTADEPDYSETNDEPSTADEPADPNVDPVRVYGDVTGDGIVNSADAFAVIRHSIGLEQLDRALLRFADIDGDGDITANDALYILRYSAGLSYSTDINSYSGRIGMEWYGA